MKINRIHRRGFMRRSLLGLAGAWALPTLVPSSSLGLAGTVAPSERILLGLIGCGNHGIHWNLRQIFRWSDAQVVAVCDVDANHLQDGQKAVDQHYAKLYGKDYKPCAAYRDFRDLIRRPDLDAVANCTPDHWHVLPALMAAKCGKDIICEKPLTLFVEEGRALCAAVEEHQRVFQTASENRSIDVYIRLVELVRGGVIGKLKHIEVRLPIGNTNMRVGGEGRGMFDQRTPTKPPAALDFDMWLGQAPQLPYIPAYVHGNFRWNLAFSGGVLTDWGAHMCDLAQWGHDTEAAGPVEVEGQGELPPRDAVHNTAASFMIRYRYADGVTMTVSAGQGEVDPNQSTDAPLVGRTSQPGIRFEGADGWIESHKWRGTLKASRREMLEVAIDPEKVKIYRPSEIIPRASGNGGEYRNFFDCVKSRGRTYAPAETGHRTITIAHLGNISMLLGRKLQWDPEAERFVNDPEANAMLGRKQREPWTLANVDAWVAKNG
jgi:predicted dehydrogenase